MLRVRLLGELTIELDDTRVEPPASRRARSLLGLLALDRRMHSRSALAARFWPEVLDESARTSLRSALSALRRSLGPDGERYLVANRDEVGLADDSLVWVDVDELERCIDEERLDDALELWRGELLAGLDDDWVYERRDEQRDKIAGVLARLASIAEDEQDLEAAIAYTRRQVALDPLAEESQRGLMRRLAAAGDRSAAIRVYERLSRRLRDELRIAPSRATRELAEALRESEETPSVAGGERVSAAPATITAPAAAVVTLLFTDLVGSTQILQEVGDDEAERLRRLHFGLLRDVASTFSGLEVKNLGDGLMVAFPSAVNAVACAIGIQQAVHRHNARHGDNRLQVRVGLNVGEPIRDEDDYFGTSVVVAKRLCDQADGGQILASELLRALVGSRGSFAFRSCGPLALKGIAEPLAACEIVWEPAEERQIPLPAAFLMEESAPLLGRDAQLTWLQSRWEEAAHGRRRVVVLGGEPGIGKTRLAAEFCRGAHADGALVLLGRCYEESLVPYRPFVEALRHYVSEASPEELRPQLGEHRSALARLLPELADPAAAPTAVASTAPEREQFLLFDAVASVLRTISDERPVVFVLDDVQWADASTLLLLRNVVRATERAPLMILATYRETEVDEEHPLAQALVELRRARVLDTMTLEGIGEEDVATLISTQSGRAATATLVRSVTDRTQGNPFFLEELLRDAAEDEELGVAVARIPESVKDVLLRRLRRLDDTCKRVVTFAAICGPEFSIDVLERATETDAEEVAESLEQAIAARIVEEAGGSIGRYGFAHTLIREVIYEQISVTRRAQLHRRVGEAIEVLLGKEREKRSNALAYHFSAAGELAKAHEYHSLAAAAADRVYAIEPALSHYTAALEAGAASGLRADREPAMRNLLLQRGRMRFRTGDLDGAGTDLKAALAAAREAGDRATEMGALNQLGVVQLRSDIIAAAALHESALEIARELGDEAAETDVLDRLAVISAHMLQFDRALELGDRALGLARGTGDDVVVGRAMDSIKLAVWQLGDLGRLAELTGQLEGLWRERGDLWYLQWTLLESAFVPIGAGRWEDAEKRLAEAVAINRRVHDGLAEVLILDARCWLERSRGAYEEAVSAGRRAVARSQEVGWEAWAAATLGWSLLEVGASTAAAEVLAWGLAAAERIGASNEIARCLSQLAWVRLRLGAADEARALADRAASLLGNVTAPLGAAFVFGAHAYVATARVLLATGAPERAEALLQPVVEAAQRSGWREAAATTDVALGLCLEAGGELDRAGEVLARAAQVADEYGLPAPGWEAHAALARVLRLGGRDQEGDRHAAAASAIAERVAAGLNDETLRERFRERANL